MARPRKRKKPTATETALAQLRGYWEPRDLSEYSHEMTKVVESAMKSMGLQDRFNEEQVFEAWSTLVTPFIAEHARPVSLDRKVLYIQVLHSSIHYELERMKGQILAKMQNAFGSNNIRDVKFRLG
ncbi:MAG: DUF721 domain-containing protein [Verrucomicrobiales bacterium]|nr:DUF721 domain-containing protein [Verrucomicrobiales bacterium]